MIRRCLILFLPAALGACAGDQGEYPSLAMRPAERATGTMQPRKAEPDLTPIAPAALDRLSRLTADAEAAHKAFVAQVAGARSIVAAGRGAAIGNDNWARAEVALADVRAARSKTMLPLADLDRLYVDAATQGEATDRIAAARDRVTSLVSAEDAALKELSANLP